MPYTTTVAGTTITASWANANVRDQVVTPFATTAARASAVTSPVIGMTSYISANTALEGIEAYNTAGQWRKPWNMPWGLLERVTGTANVVGANPSAVQIITSSLLTIPANRHILLQYSSSYTLTTGAGSLNGWELLRDASTVIDTWAVYYSGTGAGANQFIERHFVDNGATGAAHTWMVRWATTVSSPGVDSASATNIRCWTISDIGPSGAPA